MKGNPVIPPVYMTATYKFGNSDDLIEVVQNHSGYIYSRWDNPSVVAVEKALADLEGYDRALGFGSGMAAITTAIIALAHNLRLNVIAEGVETEQQRDFLIRAQCYEVQGYFYSKPVPAEDVVLS